MELFPLSRQPLVRRTIHDRQGIVEIGLLWTLNIGFWYIFLGCIIVDKSISWASKELSRDFQPIWDYLVCRPESDTSQ